MFDFWRSLSRTERRLGPASWALSLLTLVWWGVLVDNKYWAEHAYLLNLASAVTGALFGVPIAVIAFSRFGEHVTSRSVASEAARLALGDAYTVREFIAERTPPEPATTESVLRDAQDELRSIEPDDLDRLDAVVRQAAQHGVDLESSVVSVIHLDRVSVANGSFFIESLRRSMVRLGDFERTRFLALKTDDLHEAWTSLSNPPRMTVNRGGGGVSLPDGRDREVSNRRDAIASRIEESLRLLKDADTIDTICNAVIVEIEGAWPHMRRRVRPDKVPKKPRPTGSIWGRA